MAEWQKHCELVTDGEQGVTDAFYLPCDSARSYVVYESLFQNTRVTGTLFVYVYQVCDTFEIVVERHGQPSITRRITAGETNRSITLAVDCLEKITFRCLSATPPTEGACYGYYSLQLQWCKCC
ncbi:MAG: S-Ena type endospore appendage [Bacillota bacterium]